jgi:DedD protein
MDSRAKQRITGAVILVAVFVLLVPELLTGPGERQGKENEAEAAPDDAGLRSYTIDIDAPAKPAQTAQTPAAAVELPTPAASTPMAVPGEAAAPEMDATAPVTADVTAPMTAAPMASTPASTPPSAATAAPTAATQPAPVSTPAPGPAGGFAVQLGSFSSRDNANRLVRDMTAKGFAAFVAPITSNGRELYRVRVGPARDRASAEALAVQLRRIGQTGSIVSIS